MREGLISKRASQLVSGDVLAGSGQTVVTVHGLTADRRKVVLTLRTRSGIERTAAYGAGTTIGVQVPIG